MELIDHIIFLSLVAIFWGGIIVWGWMLSKL